MTPNRIVGIILLAVGCVLLALAYQQSQSVLDQTTHAIAGSYRDKTTWMLVGGAISTVLGLIALLVPARGRLGFGGGSAA